MDDGSNEEDSNSKKAKPSTKKTGAAVLKRMKVPSKRKREAGASATGDTNGDGEDTQLLADDNSEGPTTSAKDEDEESEVLALQFSNISGSVYIEQSDDGSSGVDNETL